VFGGFWVLLLLLLVLVDSSRNKDILHRLREALCQILALVVLVYTARADTTQRSGHAAVGANRVYRACGLQRFTSTTWSRRLSLPKVTGVPRKS
jgi:hypothetical protein